MNRGIDALSNMVNFGLFADNAVLGASRAMRGESLPGHQTEALNQAEQLLASLATPDDPSNESPNSTEQLRELVSSQAQAVSVARQRSPSPELEDYFTDLLALLREARTPDAQELSSDHFEELLDFFELLGEASLGEVHEEAAAIGQPAWMSSAPTSAF
jgi:hypothetical protein